MSRHVTFPEGCVEDAPLEVKEEAALGEGEEGRNDDEEEDGDDEEDGEDDDDEYDPGSL